MVLQHWGDLILNNDVNQVLFCICYIFCISLLAVKILYDILYLCYLLNENTLRSYNIQKKLSKFSTAFVSCQLMITYAISLTEKT